MKNVPTGFFLHDLGFEVCFAVVHEQYPQKLKFYKVFNGVLMLNIILDKLVLLCNLSSLAPVS